MIINPFNRQMKKKENNNLIKYSRNPKDPNDSFCKLIKNYNLTSLLEGICNVSSQIYKNNAGEFNGTITKEINITNNKIGLVKQKIIICAWDLLDISYQTILNCRNYKGKKVDNYSELYFICAAWRDVTGKYNGKLDENGKPETYDFMTFLFGLFGEQKKFQQVNYSSTFMVRDYYILNKVAPKVHGYFANFNPDEILINQIGIGQIPLLTCLLLMLTLGLYNPNIKEAETVINWNDSVSVSDFEKVINYYSLAVDKLRSNRLKRQILYSKPIINIDGTLVLANVYLPLFLYEHAIFWTIRDYYLKRNSQKFINYFGKCFEEYFKEVLYEYIETENIVRLAESDEHKQADWLLKLDDTNLIIEQKTSLMSLKCKQQNLDTSDYKKYIQDIIFKAMRQLKSSEENLDKSKVYYKIILLYEDYVKPEIIDYIFADDKCDIENDCKYWIVSIGEMEELLYLYKNDKLLFKEIFREKIQRENDNSQEGRSIEFLLSKRKARINHITQDKYQTISREVNEEINKLLINS